MKKFLVLVALLVIGCQQSVTPPQTYVAADRQTKTALTPIVDKAVTDHPEYAPAVKDVMDSWELRVKNAESGVLLK